MSYWEDQDENVIYKVVLNHEEQYSIWPAVAKIRWVAR